MCHFYETKNTFIKKSRNLLSQRPIPEKMEAERIAVRSRIRRSAVWARCVAAAFLMACLLNTGAAEVGTDEPLRVFILNSYHRGYEWSDRIMETIHSEFHKSGLNVELYFEYMDSHRYTKEQTYAFTLQLLGAKYQDVRFDVIVCSDDMALYFLRQHRDSLFPGVPVVFCGVQGVWNIKLVPKDKLITGVFERYDYESTVEIALKLHPSARQIALISENRLADFDKRTGFIGDVRKLDERIKIIDLSLRDFTMAELLEKVQQLTDDSVVLYDSAVRDSEGKIYTHEYSLTMIRKHCAVPIYITGFSKLGLGAVGGMLTDGTHQGKLAAGMAIRILNGESPDNIPVETESPNSYMFDYAQLKHFGIPVSALPEGSIVINEPQSFYYQHKREVWAGAGIIVGLTLIILLLCFNIILRRRAERGLRSAEVKYRTLVEQIPAVTYIAAMDMASTTLYVSPQIETIIGFSAEEYKADPDIWRKQLHPDDRQSVLAEVQHTHETGEPLSCEYRMITRDGRTVWLRDEALVVRDDNGKPLFLQGVMVDVTEHRKSEEQLKESEERFRAIFDNATDGIILADQETRKFSTCNETMCRMLGYDFDEVKNFTLEYIHPQEHLAYVTEQFEKQAKREITLAKDIPVKRRDGTVFYADVNSAPVRLRGETYLMGIFRDVTDRKQVEDALRESQEIFNAFMDQLPASAFIKDEKSRVQYTNSYITERFGADKWIGRTASDYFPSEIAQGVLEHDRKALAGGPSDREEWVPNLSGETRCMHTYKFPVKRQGKPVLLGAISVDVTEYRRAQDALREIRRQQSAILDTIPDIAWLKDEESRYIAANEPFGESCGVKPQDLVGKTDYDLWPKELAEKYRNDDLEVIKSRVRKRVVEPLEDKGGRRTWVETIKTPIYDERGRVVGTSGIARDMTELKKAQEHLQKDHDRLEIRVRRRTAELAKVNRELRSLTAELVLAEERARRRMAVDIHDHLSQKLAISKMRLEELAQSVRSSKSVAELREVSNMIAQTLETTRSLTFELSPPVLYELGFEAAVEWLTKQTRQQHGLSTEFTDDGQDKQLDEDVSVLLFQAVRELLVNVTKHSKARNVEVSTRRVGREIQISVEDDGVGFDTSEASSADSRSGGFGLFSIHQRLGHIGGHLNVESEPGHGTRVSLVAPINHKNRKSKRKSR
ncbi:MAG: PAS domain S-box protein [Planctomycetota bacterium]|nr:MAG: PAS domain S-box protein [Planctomycetota bacterium]